MCHRFCWLKVYSGKLFFFFFWRRGGFPVCVCPLVVGGGEMFAVVNVVRSSLAAASGDSADINR